MLLIHVLWGLQLHVLLLWWRIVLLGWRVVLLLLLLERHWKLHRCVRG